MADKNSGANEHLTQAMAEANKMFSQLGATLDEVVRGGATQLDVLDVAKRVGLDIDEKILEELQVDRIIYPLPWLPWHYWYPWRPLWCWWWRRYHPYYRCCYWWWHRYHWYPG